MSNPKHLFDGLYYYENIINDDDLMKNINILLEEFENFSFGVNPKNHNSRKVAHFGYKYEYNGKTKPIPGIPFPYTLDILRQIASKMV